MDATAKYQMLDDTPQRSNATRTRFNAQWIPTLSPREREVLQWCAQGKTSWEIARILGISERTVNFHVYQAADKLGTRGRRATCLNAYILGLIKP